MSNWGRYMDALVESVVKSKEDSNYSITYFISDEVTSKYFSRWGI